MTHTPSFTPFSEILGQERAINFLKRVLARGKVSHAYLFAGVSGVGKRTTALALTQAMNCQEPINGEGCGRCASCRQIMGGSFPDFISIEPDGQNIKIEQIRELNRALSFKSVSGRYRVSLLHQAETMTDEAANSFLKTLEEPPENDILILSVTEPLALLPTIVSRCQRVLFRPLPEEVIAKWLVDKKKLDKEMAFVAARISEGSLGRAISICESDFLERRQEYVFTLLQLPSLSRERALEMVLEYTAKLKKRATDKGDRGLFDLLDIWKTWYRDLLLVRSNCPTGLLINSDFSQKLKKLSRNAKIIDIIDSFLILDQTQRDLHRSRNVDLIMENAVLNLKRFAGKNDSR